MPWLVRRRRRRPGNTKAEAVARLERNLRDALEKAKASSGTSISHDDNDSDDNWESASDNDCYPQKGDVRAVNRQTSSRRCVGDEFCAVESATKGGATHRIGNSGSFDSSSSNNIATRSRTASKTAGKQGQSATASLSFSSTNLNGTKGSNDDDGSTTTTTNNDRNISSGGISSGSHIGGDGSDIPNNFIAPTAPSASGNREPGRPPNRRSNAAAATATTMTLTAAATTATATTTTGIASNARRMNMASSSNNNDTLPSLRTISTTRAQTDSPCYSPHSYEEFVALCDALRCNHPGVKCFSTENCDVMNASQSQLGEALVDNTVVSELHLYKNGIFTNFYDVQSTESEHFLHWLRQSPALTTVKVFQRTNHRPKCGPRITAAPAPRHIHKVAMASILQAMAQNPSIRCFDSSSSEFTTSLNSASTFAASTQQLQKLCINFDGKTGRSELEAAAIVFGEHAALKTLKIIGRNLEHFLRQWHAMPSPLAHVSDLSLDFGYQPEPDVSSAELLSNLLLRMAQLERVELNNLNLDSTCWTHIWCGLQSSPSIVDLTLRVYGCTEEAATLVTGCLQSNDATQQQHIRKFYLGDRLFQALGQSGNEKVARMLCGSLLDHLTLEFNYNNSGGQFFDSLIANASTFRLSSMVLKDADPESMPHLARFLPTARYLRHLSIEASNHYAWYSPGSSWRSPDPELSVSSEFLSSLRRNGSVETFKISCRYGGRVNDRSLLRINTYTTRNREMHELLQPSSMAPAEDAEHEPNEISPALKLFPTLVVRGALPAEKMAPHSVLKGLVNALEATGPQFDNNDPL